MSPNQINSEQLDGFDVIAEPIEGRPNGVRLTREGLYKAVWAEPVTKVAARFGVSDVAAAKWCKRMGVPVPGKGYWAKVRAGKDTRQKGLPVMQADFDDEILLRRPRVLEEQEECHSETPADVLEEIAYWSASKSRITVKKRLVNPHALVERTRKAYSRVWQDQYGRAVPEGRKARLHLNVWEKSIPRALRIIDALVKRMEKRGYRVDLSERPDGYGRHEDGSHVVIFGERVEFHVFEASKRTQRPLTDEEQQKLEDNPDGCVYISDRFQYHSGGRLMMIVGKYSWSKSDWVDREGEPLEDQLTSFVRALIWEAAHERQCRLGREESRRLWEERERKEREDQKRIEGLESLVSKWQRANGIRSFAIAAGERLDHEEAGNEMEVEDLRAWVDWAKDYADSVDPLLNEPFSKPNPGDNGIRFEPGEEEAEC